MTRESALGAITVRSQEATAVFCAKWLHSRSCPVSVQVARMVRAMLYTGRPDDLSSHLVLPYLQFRI